MGTPLACGRFCRMLGMGPWVPVSADEVSYQIKMNHVCVLKSVWQCLPIYMGHLVMVEVDPSRIMGRKPKQQHIITDRMKELTIVIDVGAI